MAKDLLEELEVLISFLNLIDTRLRERPLFKEHLQRPPPRLAPLFLGPHVPLLPHRSPGDGVSVNVPIQLRFTYLSEAEHAVRRRREGRCLYCALRRVS